MKLKLVLLAIIGTLILVATLTYREYDALKAIDSYESCTTAKGSVIQESYPATCVTQLGARYQMAIENVETINWTIYTNNDYGFSITYPPDFSLQEPGKSDKVSEEVSPSQYTQKAPYYVLLTNESTIKPFRISINPEGFLGHQFPLDTAESKSELTLGDHKVDAYYKSSLGTLPSYIRNYQMITNFKNQKLPNFAIHVELPRTSLENEALAHQILSSLKFTN